MMATLHHDVLFQRARQAYAANQLDEARRICEQLVASNRNDVRVVVMLGQIAFSQTRFKEAASYMRRAAALRPGDPQVHAGLGEILALQGRIDEAISEYDKVLRRDPQHALALAGKAGAHEVSGRRDEARALLRPLVEHGLESAPQAAVQARLDLHDRNYDAVIDLVNRHLERGDAGGYILRGLYLYLGQALERTKRFDEAFAAYERGNTVIPTHFDAEIWVQEIDDLLEAFSPQRFANVPHGSHGSPLPIFVLGMPRSGSTLVETILDAHPDVAAAGELAAMQELVNSMSLDIGSSLPYPSCIEDLDQNLGMLALLFPEARIIHCRRHPLDTCFSCFQTPLSPTTHSYARDLAGTGVAYVAYERLMTHWRDVLKIPMHEVRYEALVADQEGETRRLLDFCGLDFDERCLRFYERERVVLTASYDQVNRPVYTSSVGRYRNFDKHLGPLKVALAEGGWTEEALARATAPSEAT
jgi:tetratricopeptide (TPR) repeat protein